MSLFGHTRTIVSARHALIAPDGHVPSSFHGWKNATAYVLISPAMGSEVSQILVTFDVSSGKAAFPSDEHEHVIYVEAGECEIELAEESISLTDGGYIFIPWHTSFNILGNDETRVTIPQSFRVSSLHRTTANSLWHGVQRSRRAIPRQSPRASSNTFTRRSTL